MSELLVSESVSATERSGSSRPMSTRWWAAAVAVLVLALAAVMIWGLSRDNGDGADASVVRLHDALAAAWSNADGAAVAALFTKDGVLDQYLVSPLYTNPRYVSEGREAITRDINAYGNRGFRNWRVSRVTVSGPFSSAAGQWEMGGRRGDAVMVLQRTDDGLIERASIFSFEK